MYKHSLNVHPTRTYYLADSDLYSKTGSIYLEGRTFNRFRCNPKSISSLFTSFIDSIRHFCAYKGCRLCVVAFTRNWFAVMQSKFNWLSLHCTIYKLIIREEKVPTRNLIQLYTSELSRKCTVLGLAMTSRVFVFVFWPQKHVTEAPFLRLYDFTVFVATASAANP